MSDNWLDQNSGGGGYPSVKFPAVGDKVVGTIISTPRVVGVTNDKGEPEERLVVELEAVDGCTATIADGGIGNGDNVSLWIKPGFLASAVKDAVKAAGAKGLTEGATLAVAFTDTKDTGKIQKAKVYAAKYVPAKPSVSVDDLI